MTDTDRLAALLDAHWLYRTDDGVFHCTADDWFLRPDETIAEGDRVYPFTQHIVVAMLAAGVTLAPQPDTASREALTWHCVITGPGGDLPPGADLPMRMAVREAYLSITGNHETTLSSGWAAPQPDTASRHGYTCDLCDWGRDHDSHDGDEYAIHLRREHCRAALATEPQP